MAQREEKQFVLCFCPYILSHSAQLRTENLRARSHIEHENSKRCLFCAPLSEWRFWFQTSISLDLDQHINNRIRVLWNSLSIS